MTPDTSKPSASSNSTALVTPLIVVLRLIWPKLHQRVRIRSTPQPLWPPLLVGLQLIRPQLHRSFRPRPTPRPLWPQLLVAFGFVWPYDSCNLRCLSALGQYGPSCTTAFNFVRPKGPCGSTSRQPQVYMIPSTRWWAIRLMWISSHILFWFTQVNTSREIVQRKECNSPYHKWLQ